MSNNVKRPRRLSFKDEAIDVDDLASMSNMGGMLSFLETRPEDYARLFAKASEAERSRLGDLSEPRTTQGLTTHLDSTQRTTTHASQGVVWQDEGGDHSEKTNSAGSLVKTSQPITTQLPTTQEDPAQSSTTPNRTTQPVTTHPFERERASGSSPSQPAFRKAADILSLVIPSESTAPTSVISTQAATTHLTPTHEQLFPNTKKETPEPQALGLSPTVSLGRGRIHQLRIREAKIVQDGHTGSEQMVYDFLWRTGTPLNANLHSIRIGRWGIANAVHISDTTAKAALKGLIEKLAIDRIGGSDSVLGFEYHVHSWGSCLTRRKERGLTHIIKSKGVVFVNPQSGEPITGYFFPGKSITTQGTTTQAVSRLDLSATRVVDTQARGVEQGSTTQVVVEAYPYNQLQNQTTITTTLVREELELHTLVDEAGIKSLIRAVQNNAKDASWQELQHFIREKAKVFKKVKVENKFGFLLVAVPRCFESPAFQTWRLAMEAQALEQKAQENKSRQFLELQHLHAILIDPTASDDEKQAAQEVIEALDR